MNTEEFTKKPYEENKSIQISYDLLEAHQKRRSTRDFNQTKINDEIIKNAIRVAGSAPSGANKQPWHFVVVSNDQIKKKIQDLAEIEEEDFYVNRPNKQWVEDLKFLNPQKKKPFLTDASHLILVFYKNIDRQGDGVSKNYYAKESTGIATGMLISNLHLMGISTLTYTPRRMQFMKPLFNLDKDYIPFMLLVAGIGKETQQVPVISKKTINEILDLY